MGCEGLDYIQLAEDWNQRYLRSSEFIYYLSDCQLLKKQSAVLS